MNTKEKFLIGESSVKLIMIIYSCITVIFLCKELDLSYYHEEIFSSANPLDARILNENSKLNISTLFSVVQIHNVKDSYKDSRL